MGAKMLFMLSLSHVYNSHIKVKDEEEVVALNRTLSLLVSARHHYSCQKLVHYTVSVLQLSILKEVCNLGRSSG